MKSLFPLRHDLGVGKYQISGKKSKSQIKTWYCLISFRCWAELLEACHSMLEPSSPQENSVKKHVHGLLRIFVRLKFLVNAIGQHK